MILARMQAKGLKLTYTFSKIVYTVETYKSLRK